MRIDGPFVFFVGPQKTGTSLIAEILRSSPKLSLPQGVKETFFFDRNFENGINWYNGFFRHTNDTVARVEVAPTYFHSRDAISKIFQSCENPKIVITLREPIARSASHYFHLKKYGFVDTDITTALIRYPEICLDSLYFSSLMKWIEVFGREDVCIGFFDDMIQAPKRWIESIFDEAGVCSIGSLRTDSSNKERNEMRVPYSPRLAKLGQVVADYFRNKDAYNFVNLAKRLGLKKVFFSGKLPIDRNEVLDKIADRYSSTFRQDRLEMLQSGLIVENKLWL